ncbi:MAG: hypothetical protein WCO10_03210 [bacterium]
MKAAKIEKLYLGVLIAVVVSVFIGIAGDTFIKAYKDGHDNVKMIKIRMPATSQIISANDFAEMVRTNAILSNLEIVGSLGSHDRYEKMIQDIKEPCYIVMCIRYIKPALSCVYRVRSGAVWLQNMEDYEIPDVGGAYVKSLTYVGDGKVEIRTEFNLWSYFWSGLWGVMVGLFFVLVAAIILFVFYRNCLEEYLWNKKEKEHREELELKGVSSGMDM